MMCSAGTMCFGFETTHPLPRFRPMRGGLSSQGIWSWGVESSYLRERQREKFSLLQTQAQHQYSYYFLHLPMALDLTQKKSVEKLLSLPLPYLSMAPIELGSRGQTTRNGSK